MLEEGNPPISRPEGNGRVTPRRFRAEGQALRYHAFTGKLAHVTASQMAGVLVRMGKDEWERMHGCLPQKKCCNIGQTQNGFTSCCRGSAGMGTGGC